MRLFTITRKAKSCQEPRVCGAEDLLFCSKFSKEKNSFIQPIRLIGLIGLFSFIVCASPIAVQARSLAALPKARTIVPQVSRVKKTAPVSRSNAKPAKKVVAKSRKPAKPRPVVKAEKIIQSDYHFAMTPGETKHVKVGFRNDSEKIIWKQKSKNYASLYPVGPRSRKSQFADKSWISKNHVAKISDKEVKPGEIGYVEFEIKAPDAMGDYIEDYGLALEGLAWVEGTPFEMHISVVPKEKIAEASKNISHNLASPHVAELLLQSQKSLTLEASATTTIRFGFKNVGKLAWNNRGIRSFASVRIAAEEGAPITDWFNSENPVSIAGEPPVKPGEIGFIDLAIKAPTQGGKYTLRVALVVDDQIVNGGEVEIPVEVLPEASSMPLPVTEFVPVMQEPTIRVGLEKTKEPILITANAPYEIRDGAGNPLGIVPAGVVSITRFDPRTLIYSVETGTISYASPQYLRFLGTVASSTIFEIKSMIRHPYFSNEINDNTYRGGLEVRFSDSGNLWVINELGLEDYLLGLSENRDSAPLEFHKAQAIAARTYAYYNVANGGKYKKGYFDLTWTPADQVYRGYGSEIRMQNLAEAARETKGMFVTYNGHIVTTPYFAQSNGRTKPWGAVWGGSDKPWLQSVPAPFDEGKRERGHGVGMSQLDAIWRAEQGANHEEILKYYYRGIELKRLY